MNFTNDTINWREMKSVMAERPHARTSDRYSFVPTFRVIELLEKHGWEVASARETNAQFDRQGFQKHMIRFRQKGDAGRMLQVDELIPEILLKTAHDASAAFNLMAAFERCWCSNQCTVSDSTIASHRVLHKGYTDEKIMEAVYHIVEDTPKVIESVERFKAIPLSNEEQRIFGDSALTLLYDDKQMEKYVRDVSVNRLLKPKRTKDSEKNLWNTYNVVQEKFLKGDRFLVEQEAIDEFYDRESGERFARGRKNKKIKSIDKDIKLNKALWSLTEAMANLKAV
ncbi:hypothetical protein CMI47_04005 [Candidatus Pacearchaeota archaeon]|jgi:hypothetical protein|nr:hypothetical protein [Candidatus Pacearchaeota archaeon]|tara:strand:+ start:355 stop:1203 length:849 start_codon:yes stop_codon:yes gene_type:complete